MTSSVFVPIRVVLLCVHLPWTIAPDEEPTSFQGTSCCLTSSTFVALGDLISICERKQLRPKQTQQKNPHSNLCCHTNPPPRAALLWITDWLRLPLDSSAFKSAPCSNRTVSSDTGSATLSTGNYRNHSEYCHSQFHHFVLPAHRVTSLTPRAVEPVWTSQGR